MRCGWRWAEGGGEGGGYRAGAAAQVDGDSGLWGEGDRLVYKEFCALARDEDARFHRYAQTAELGPAEDLLQR
jgi:hypothetical protein